MRLLPWQNALLDRLRSALGPHIDVLDGGYNEEDEVGRLENGMIAPYVLVWFGGAISAGPGFSGICGERSKTRTTNVFIESVGTTMTHARQLGDEVRDALIGFRPNGEGELAEDSSPVIRNPINIESGTDVRYSYPIAFNGIVNTTTP